MKFPLVKIWTVFLLLFAFAAKAEDCIPEKPSSYPFYVHDEAGVLSPEQLQTLESGLKLFDDSTSNQIVVVIVKDLCGYDRAMFGTELLNRWGVGQKEKDNGVVVLIKPTETNGNRTTFIAVGRGLEAVITDAQCSYVVKEVMNPRFKQGDIYGGIVEGLNVLMPLAKGEFSEANLPFHPAWGFIVLIIVVIVFRIFIARSYSRRNGVSLWTALWLSSMMRGGGGSSWGDFSSGGGGFGGFGGGSSGGGGAGGDW